MSTKSIVDFPSYFPIIEISPVFDDVMLAKIVSAASKSQNSPCRRRWCCELVGNPCNEVFFSFLFFIFFSPIEIKTYINTALQIQKCAWGVNGGIFSDLSKNFRVVMGHDASKVDKLLSVGLFGLCQPRQKTKKRLVEAAFVREKWCSC